MMYILSPTHKVWGIVVFFLSLIGSLMELLGVSVILPFSQMLVDADSLRDNNYIDGVCHLLGIQTTSGLMVLMTASVIGIYVFKNLYLTFLVWFRTRYSTRVVRELSLKMIRSYVDRGYSYLRNTNSAILFRGCTGSIESIFQIINCFFRIFTDCLTLLFLFIFISVTDPIMALTMIVVSLIALGVITMLFRRPMKRAGEDRFNAEAESNQWMHQLFHGIKEVLVMRKSEYFLDNFKKSYTKMQNANLTSTVAQSCPSYFIETVCVAGLMTAVCSRIITLDNPATYVASLATFAIAAFRMLPSIGRISSTFSYFLFQIPPANEVYDNMREAEEYKNAKHITDAHDTDDEASGHVFTDNLTISDVSFRYPDADTDVLTGINLVIKRGESVALVGPSGAGKTTLADIILGLYRPVHGSVTMDGLDIHRNPCMWSENVGFVPQSVYLIDDTVRRNVAFGHADDDIDDDLIWSCLEKAQIKDFVKGLPKGLNTIVGERGVKFSGGQTQRMAIARALYNDPQILVLDEATSALDNDTERAIMDTINVLKGHKTLIIIAHRLTTIQQCDHIYEIRDGAISERNFNELN